MAVSPLIWLAQPTRFADLSRGRARIALAALMLLLLAAALTTLARPDPRVPDARATSTTDHIVILDGIVDGMRHGGDYYTVATDELPEHDSLNRATDFRLPLLAEVEAALPPWGVVGLLYALAAGVMAAWSVRLRQAFARWAPLVLTLALLGAGMAAVGLPELVSVHELWAGLLIALSLALRRPGRWVAAAGIGALALLVRETSALYVVVMAVTAWVEDERREAIGWLAAIGLLASAMVAHAHAIGDAGGWPGATTMLGFGYFIDAVARSTALWASPPWASALAIALSLFGWAGWRDPAGVRALATFTLYAGLIALFARADTYYLGLMAAPTILLGLAFVPDALRDAIAAAFPRKRNIVVTRLK